MIRRGLSGTFQLICSVWAKQRPLSGKIQLNGRPMSPPWWGAGALPTWVRGKGKLRTHAGPGKERESGGTRVKRDRLD